MDIMENDNIKHNLLFGNNIRTARKQKKISLEELSKGAKMSIGYLSLLERGKVNISVNNLRKIADFLDVTMVDFFEENTPQKNGHVTRKNKGQCLEVDGSTAYSESLITKRSSTIQATIYRNPPQEGRIAGFSHYGEECIYIISGEIMVRLDDQKYHLKEGDTIYFRSDIEHSWVNPGDVESVIIVFNSPQVW